MDGMFIFWFERICDGLHMTQEQFADAIVASRKKPQRWKNGDQEPSPTDLRLIQHAEVMLGWFKRDLEKVGMDLDSVLRKVKCPNKKVKKDREQEQIAYLKMLELEVRHQINLKNQQSQSK